jgi:hypothetical protein
VPYGGENPKRLLYDLIEPLTSAARILRQQRPCQKNSPVRSLAPLGRVERQGLETLLVADEMGNTANVSLLASLVEAISSYEVAEDTAAPAEKIETKTPRARHQIEIRLH